MTLPVGVSIGERIGALRVEAGLSQRALAARANVSYSLLTKVEAGHKPASAAFLAAVARALRLKVGDLQPEPYSDGMGPKEPLLPLMAPIRAALDLYDLPPQEDARPRPITALRLAVRRINALAQAADYKPMCAALPGLLAELHAAAHLMTGEDQRQAWGLLAEAYRCGHSVGIAIGLNDMSAAALSRMDWAAQRAGDRAPGLRAAREYLRVTAYLRTGDLDACRRLQDSGRSYLDGTDPKTPGALVAAGQLHLGSAVVAARAQDVDLMTHHLDEAERLAQATGETGDFSLHFGPTNVQVHLVMTLVEASRHDRAVAAAKGMRFPAGWAPTRIGHHHIDLARANRWMARPEAALDHLDAAFAVAPQQASRHPLVRETVSALSRAGGRRSSRLSAWIARTGI
ncbi:helix-turn-helix domain-containing protein [Streptomyces sp. FH025]|uniref:helix-turn-helix domain-containing protein n=1 Tax=Streptomyces sp. FH025 TaxID=2815937 RepID=UPI001A9D21C7|nr:helix-turn-helix transcriptional regulator [Streptomyces sp. FH025]MBO1416711.1 helix-turn-helix transcriptional regulator [Streptomyces sp. FH025]